METLSLFPAEDLYVAPAVVESEPTDEPEPACIVIVIPGQLDLFTGEVTA